MKGNAEQHATTRQQDVPKHFIPISKFGCHKGGISKGSEEYKALYRAWANGTLGGVRLMRGASDPKGRIFVDPDDARRVIHDSHAEALQPAAPQRVASNERRAAIDAHHAEAAVIALCEINNGISLMQATLERLTAAVELIATQPKTAQQDLVSTFEGNGFHQ